MATNLSGETVYPLTTSEVVGTSYVEFTVSSRANRVDVYFDTNDGFFSYEEGAPAVDAPIPADTWFVLWQPPSGPNAPDFTFQLKAASAGTTVFLRVV